MLTICRISDIIERDTADTADCARKVFVDHAVRDTDRFKDLAALIGLDRGDSHLRRDLYDTEEDRIIIIFNSCVVILIQQILLDFAESIKRALKTRKSVTFLGLGRLRATKENAWFFIPDEDLDRLFTPGFSTKINYETGVVARGLGLPIVQDIVEHTLHGRISVETGPGGTRFDILLPKEELEVMGT